MIIDILLTFLKVMFSIFILLIFSAVIFGMWNMGRYTMSCYDAYYKYEREKEDEEFRREERRQEQLRKEREEARAMIKAREEARAKADSTPPSP